MVRKVYQRDCDYGRNAQSFTLREALMCQATGYDIASGSVERLLEQVSELREFVVEMAMALHGTNENLAVEIEKLLTRFHEIKS